MKLNGSIPLIMCSVGLAIAGCSAHSSTLPAQAIQRRTPLSFTATIPPNTGTYQGQIYQLQPDEMQMNGAGPSLSCGKLDAFYNQNGTTTNVESDTGSTTPAVNNYVQVTGAVPSSAQCPSQISSATYMTLSTSPIPEETPSGIITSVNSNGTFYITTSNNTTDLIIPNSSYDGGTPSEGENASITGYGIATGTQHFIHATHLTMSTPSPLPSASAHVITFDFGQEGSSTYMGSASAVAQWLSWAMTDTPYTTGFDADAQSYHIKLMRYSDNNYPKDPASGLVNPTESVPESGWSHIAVNGACSTTERVKWTNSGTVFDWYDPASSAFITAYENWINDEPPTSGGHWDAVMEDNAGPIDGYSVSGTFNAFPCNYNASTWIANEATMEQNLYNTTHVQTIAQSLNDDASGTTLSPSLQLFIDDPIADIGGRYDQCYAAENGHLQTGNSWIPAADTELKMASLRSSGTQPMFVCLAADDTYGSGAIPSRMYVIASFLLTYDTTNTPSTSALWEYYGFNPGTPSAGSTFHVYPESQIIVRYPAKSNITEVGQLKYQTTTVYTREYSQCFLAGTFVGPCAVAVNSGTTGATNPLASNYGHTLLLSGNDLLDGGTASATGPAPSSTLNGPGGVVMFP